MFFHCLSNKEPFFTLGTDTGHFNATGKFFCWQDSFYHTRKNHIMKHICVWIEPEISWSWQLMAGTNIAESFLFSSAGNLLQADFQSWECVTGTISGPPCPPFSAIGARRREDDIRWQVFRRVSDILVDQGRKAWAEPMWEWPSVSWISKTK